MLQKKEGLKKTCYICGKLGHLKPNCPKGTIKVSEKWIEMIEEPETTTKINHENLLWTICSDDQCWVHRSFKENAKWYPKIYIYIFGKKPSISSRFYPTETPVTTVMMIKIGKSKIPALITQDTENMMSISFANRIKRYLNNECIRIGEGTIQHVIIESKHEFLKSTGFGLKERSKRIVVLGQQWKKEINAQINPGVKKQGMTPQTIHMLAYKNAIAKGYGQHKNYLYKMLSNSTR